MEKVLRVGVILGGKIVEEQLFGEGERVSVGWSPRCSIVVDSSSLPESFTLFEPHGDGVALNLTPTLDGRVAAGTEVSDFATLRSSGAARRDGELFRLRLDPSSRGKVQLGDVTILFQYVARPPAPPRPQLPASVRQGWRGNTDWVFVSIFLVSFAAHIGLVGYLGLHDFEVARAWDDDVQGGLADIPRVLTAPREVEPSPPTETTSSEDTTREPAPAPAVRKNATKVNATGEDIARRAAERRVRMADQVSRSVAALVGARGGKGNLADALSRGGLGDVDRAFDNIGGTQLGNAISGPLGARGGGANGRLQRIGELGSRGAQDHAIGDRSTERAVKAVARIQDTSVDGRIDASIVGKEIRSRLKSVQLCYERVLKRDRTLSGKIGLRFTIGVVGSVTAVAIDSDNVGDASVSDCIKTAVRRWRFPAPDGGPAEVITPIVLQAAR